MTETFYRRNLPHIHPETSPLFVTLRQANSLPLEILRQLKLEREQEFKLAASRSRTIIPEIEQEYFRCYDDWLDRCEMGAQWLRDPNVTSIVSN
jgi:putative transposase